MRLLVQRVESASVAIDGVIKSEIAQGLLLLLGVATDDSQEDVEWLVQKVTKLRIFDDLNGVMNLDIRQIGGDAIVVSQFTLFASTKKGNRPSYIRSAPEPISKPLYESFIVRLSELLEREVGSGEFGADMKVSLINDGPVTIWIDSKCRE